MCLGTVIRLRACENAVAEVSSACGDRKGAVPPNVWPWSEQGVRLTKIILCKLAHAFLQEYSDKWLKSAQLLGQLDNFLTWPASERQKPPTRIDALMTSM